MGFILLTLVSHQSYLATAILVHLRQWCSQHTTHQGHPDTNKTTAKKRIVPVHELRVWERVFRKCYLRSPVLAVFACVSVAAETVSYMGLATKNYIWECLNRFLFNLVLVKIVLISGVCVCVQLVFCMVLATKNWFGGCLELIFNLGLATPVLVRCVVKKCCRRV